MRVSEKIYYNINESTLVMMKKGYNFYFTSDFNMNRFEPKIEELTEQYYKKYAEVMEYSGENKLLFEIIDTMILEKAYKHVERRGYRIEKA